MYQKVAEDVFGAQTEFQLSSVIESVCMHIFEPEITAYYSLDLETGVYSRISFRKIEDSNFDELPVSLKIESSHLPTSHFTFYYHNAEEKTFFECAQLASNNFAFIPIYSQDQIHHFMICVEAINIKNIPEKTALISILVNSASIKAENFNKENSIQRLGDLIQKNSSHSILRLQTVNEKLRKSNKELKQFAYQASHDFQEPLRMITTYIDLFYKKFGDTLNTDGLEYLTFARNGAARLSSLAKDLLTYAKLESTDEISEQFDGNKMIHDVLQNLQVAIKESNAFVFYSNMPDILGNESEISRLFQNVIDNGIKYKGEKDPVIFIDYTETDYYHNFSVLDNGIGVAPEHQQKIFDFFTRLHSKEEYSGTGLGLSICKKIAEKHGGNISMSSVLDKGSKFVVAIKKNL